MTDNLESLYEYDEAVRNSVGTFCGVDEAGRGPLAGDVYAAAVIPVSYTHLTLPTIA